MSLPRLITYSFLLVILGLFFFSFTQVDLSLTLSQVSLWQTIQKSFQQIGYFNRPLSAALFLVIISLMFSYYIYFLYRAYKKRINKKDIWVIVFLTGVILTFSYNAFSYDLFNYIFDAKIITFYNQNPYFHKALDFPGDPMLSFMHWTHRYYPYGPFWLVLTTPLSFIGANIFLLTFFLFKGLATAFFLGSVYLIYKITEKINPEYSLFATTLFALNPLVIIEGLVSAHNDIAMVFFALFGIYLFVIKRKILGILLVSASTLIKIPTTILLLPMLINTVSYKKIHLSQDNFFLSIVILGAGGIAYSLTRLEIQPWYFLWVFPFICLLKPNKYIIVAGVGLSLGLLLRYLPFLYFGTWDGIVLPIRNYLTIFAVIIPLIPLFLADLIRKG